jgi:radical SAM superfamily enzyme YgiQ (UPF0313 family)
MHSIGNLICLTPLESYVVDGPKQKNGFLGKLERRIGPFVRSPGLGFPYIVGFLRKNGVLAPSTRVVVQHDRIEGVTPFEEILEEKVDLSRGAQDVLFITSFTDSTREAYRRAREAREVFARAGRKLTVVLGGAHASALPSEATRLGHADATVAGEGEWAAAELLGDLEAGRAVKPAYSAAFARIRDKGTLTLDTSIWQGLRRPPQQIVSSTHSARGCKLSCQFCAVFLTNGQTVRNRDISDVVEELRSQGPAFTRDSIDQIGPGLYNSVLLALVKTPFIGRRYGDRMIARMGPGFTDQFFFWDDNLYNAHGSFKALCEAVKPLRRPWGAELTIDIASRPDLLKLAYESGCRNLFVGIESISQTVIDGLDKWSNDAMSMKESVKRVHDAGINVMGAFVFGLDADEVSAFDRTLEFIYATGIDFVVANIIQPYPGTGTFRDAVANESFLPWAESPIDSDVAMYYNWPLFDGAHVITRPRGMTIEQLQEGYYRFLREAYSLTGIVRRFRGNALDGTGFLSHLTLNYLLSRYGMTKTAHARARRAGATVRPGADLPARESSARPGIPAAAPATD